jgi:hypothetical protein
MYRNGEPDDGPSGTSGPGVDRAALDLGRARAAGVLGPPTADPSRWSRRRLAENAAVVLSALFLVVIGLGTLIAGARTGAPDATAGGPAAVSAARPPSATVDSGPDQRRNDPRRGADQLPAATTGQGLPGDLAVGQRVDVSLAGSTRAALPTATARGLGGTSAAAPRTSAAAVARAGSAAPVPTVVPGTPQAVGTQSQSSAVQPEPSPAVTPPPPADTPPAETPAETPPAEIPPAETPPAETPPAETPPAETPPTETPPAETPADIPVADLPTEPVLGA